MIIGVKILFEKDVPNKYNLAWVYNYESALEETPHAEYDMYLLDYDLGHHTGLELLKKIREQGCRIPIIFLTDEGNRALDVEVIKGGMVDFLYKNEVVPSPLESSIHYPIERNRTEEALAESEKQRRSLAAQLLEVQEKERKRIALEIHDVLGSSLGAIKYKLESLVSNISTVDIKTLADSMNALIPIVQETIGEVRRLQSDLRPPLLDDLGIVPTLSWFCRRFETIYSGIKVENAVTIQEEGVPDHLKIILFRITQEAMNNIGKHAQADSVYLGLRKVDKAIELCIKDNGKGFDPESLSSRGISRKGLGFSGMKERIKFSGGSFSIESSKGKGTVIRAVWPV